MKCLYGLPMLCRYRELAMLLWGMAFSWNACMGYLCCVGTESYLCYCGEWPSHEIPVWLGIISELETSLVSPANIHDEPTSVIWSDPKSVRYELDQTKERIKPPTLTNWLSKTPTNHRSLICRFFKDRPADLKESFDWAIRYYDQDPEVQSLAP